MSNLLPVLAIVFNALVWGVSWWPFHVLQGMGVRRAIEGRGLKMGRDVSVIIFDDDLSYLKNGEDVPIFTATRSSVKEAGRLAAEMLLGVISQSDLPPQHRMLEAELILGQSTGPAPG